MPLTCPIPISEYPKVLLAHGSGGVFMHQLIDRMFLSTFGNAVLDQGHDSAVFRLPSERLALTTDSYVVNPLFFPGGDIGTLAVYGTVNDLAMSGAKPVYLTAAFILEEGLDMDVLWRVVQSMQTAAEETGVRIITGDTKVVEHGKADGLFINTAGVGVLNHALTIGPASIKPGDAIILNGDLGRHGIAIMAVREGLAFARPLQSDCAALSKTVEEMIGAGVEVHCLRDLTRGGLASALVEIAGKRKMSITVDEKRVPVCEEVHAACEILGFDPFYIANEGRFVCFVPESSVSAALKIIGDGAVVIGHVHQASDGLVTVKSAIGTTRIMEMLPGEQLPRIC
jgi:hydrogenase expression/formation protein HypE